MSDNSRIKRLAGVAWRRLIVAPIQVACVLGLALGAVSYGAGAHRYLELTSHFTRQYFYLSLVCCLAMALLPSRWFAKKRRIAWAAVALAGCLLHLSAIAPWYVPRESALERTAAAAPLHPSSPPPQRLRLLLANVFYGNTDYQRFLSYVAEERPDVVVCQEFTERWRVALEPLRSVYPHAVTVPKYGGAGIALYSKHPLNERFVLDLGVASRPCILVNLDLGDGAAATILTMHPQTPLAAENFAARNKQLVEAAELLRKLPGHKVLIGDLNVTLWSPFLREAEDRSGMVNARRGFGVLPSWPTHLPEILRLPIDQCFVSPEVGVAEIRTGRHIGSDHLPLIVDLDVPVR